jgi:hypothetical protein
MVRSNINPIKQDSIAVFVIFDGIEKMDKTVLEHINRLQNNLIRIDLNIQ